jgi:hypothetical protein
LGSLGCNVFLQLCLLFLLFAQLLQSLTCYRHRGPSLGISKHTSTHHVKGHTGHVRIGLVQSSSRSNSLEGLDSCKVSVRHLASRVHLPQYHLSTGMVSTRLKSKAKSRAHPKRKDIRGGSVLPTRNSQWVLPPQWHCIVTLLLNTKTRSGQLGRPSWQSGDRTR